MKQYTKYPNTKRKGGDFNETVETRRKGSTENADETQGQSQNGKTVQTSKSEEKMKWYDIDKTVGESRFWQVVGAILLIAVLYFIVFELGRM